MIKQEIKEIAIIGGGFSGLAVLLHLVEKSSSPIKINLIEKTGTLCKGVAFGTSSPYHPLNVVAENMGAFAKAPQDFYNWLLENPSKWEDKFKGLEVSPKAFLPRMLYAEYLQSRFTSALDKARQKNIAIRLIHDEVVDIQEQKSESLTLITKDKRTIHANYVVLAVGVPPVKKLPFETEKLLSNCHYTHNCWNQIHSFEEIKTPQVVIIGSGLTAIDTLFALTKGGYKGKILIISKSGGFPQPHSESNHHSPISNLPIGELPNRCVSMVKFLKEQWRAYKTKGANWKHFVDAIRPHAQQLWQGLSLTEKKRFLRHLFSIWNLYRHRMTPESKNMIDELIKDNRLSLIVGYVCNVTSGTNEKLEVHYISATAKEEVIMAGHVFNCSGPQYDLTQTSNSLIKMLIQKKLIEQDDLGMGLKVIRNEVLAGKGEGKIFSIGSLLFGERFETTAVPEIRVQADSIAEEILRKDSGARSQESGGAPHSTTPI
jgi:uncharacterized NAD(P)/FAD-binding protein YdhS